MIEIRDKYFTMFLDYECYNNMEFVYLFQNYDKITFQISNMLYDGYQCYDFKVRKVKIK